MLGYYGERLMFLWWFTAWWNIQLGVTLALAGPHLEIHVPFGFLKIGIPGGHSPPMKIGFCTSKQDYMNKASLVRLRNE